VKENGYDLAEEQRKEQRCWREDTRCSILVLWYSSYGQERGNE